MAIRPYLQAKNGAVGPHIIGPTDFVQWAAANQGNYQRGEINVALLTGMLDKLFDEGKWPSKGVSLRFTPGAPYIGALDDLARGIAGATLAPPRTAVDAGNAVDLNAYYMGRLTKVTKMMCAFALNMESSPFPAARHYHTITTGEANDGVTVDFVSKHVSSTVDAKSTKKVAEIRGAPVAARQGIAAFGNIVTQRSGGLMKEELPEFTKEIKSRQAEFTSTYADLGQFYADNCEFLRSGGNTNFDVLCDHITFITQKKYKMYEYVSGKGGEESCFIHFGVSCSADGKKWAVHHLAMTSLTRVIGHGVPVNTAITAVDATTSMRDPY